MTPELKAYLDEWRAEHKSMFDEMLNTLRRLLTELSCHPKNHYLKLDFLACQDCKTEVLLLYNFSYSTGKLLAWKAL
jgi:mRNA-degrading endonuclease YafQ of YafQ-DinJ toxin-antitoxin module